MARNNLAAVLICFGMVAISGCITGGHSGPTMYDGTYSDLKLNSSQKLEIKGVSYERYLDRAPGYKMFRRKGHIVIALDTLQLVMDSIGRSNTNPDSLSPCSNCIEGKFIRRNDTLFQTHIGDEPMVTPEPIWRKEA